MNLLPFSWSKHPPEEVRTKRKNNVDSTLHEHIAEESYFDVLWDGIDICDAILGRRLDQGLGDGGII